MIFIPVQGPLPGWEVRNGIVLPPTYVAEVELRRRQYWEVLATWADLAGSPATEERLTELASQLNAESAITLISVLSTLLNNRRGDAAKRQADQISAAIEFLPESVADRVVELFRQKLRHRWLHEEQLLAAMRLLILHGKPGPIDGAPDRRALAELLLGINDVIIRLGLPGESAEQEGVRMVLRSLGMLASEQERYLIPRFQDLLLVKARARQGDRGAIDLDGTFGRATGGLTLAEYLAAALIYVGPFTGIHDVKTLAAVNYRQVLGDYEKRHRDPSKAAACAEQFVGTIDWFRDRFAAQAPRPMPYWDYLPFKQRPLIRLYEGGSPIPISFSFLMQKLATGAYFLLEDQARVDDPTHGVQRFRGFFGGLFEEYAQQVLARTLAPVAGAVFVPETAISGGGPGVKKPDAIIQQGSSLVVFESTVTALSDAAVVASDPAAFELEIKSKHMAKASQLRNGIEALAAGQLVAAGVDMSVVREIYPVLLLLYPFPHFGFTVKPLREALRPGQIGRGALEVRALTVMSAEELEMIEPILADGPVALSELLALKEGSRATSDTSLKNFLLSEGVPGSLENPKMRQLYDERFKAPELQEALHRLFVFDDDPDVTKEAVTT
jgi:hypothetical protein